MARLEPQRQERAGQQQDDEAVERDLAQHERPVVGEDLARAALDEVRRAEPLVDLVGGRRRPPSRVPSGAHLVPRSWARPAPGSRRWTPSIPRRRRSSGSWGRGRAAGPKITCAVLGHVERRLVARAEQVVGLLLVQADRAADVGADLGVGDDAVVRPALAASGSVISSGSSRMTMVVALARSSRWCGISSMPSGWHVDRRSPIGTSAALIGPAGRVGDEPLAGLPRGAGEAGAGQRVRGRAAG